MTISGTLTQSIELNVNATSGKYSFKICDCKGSISGFKARVGGTWLRCVKHLLYTVLKLNFALVILHIVAFILES